MSRADHLTRLLSEVRERLERKRSELPKLAQPGKSYLKDLSDLAKLLAIVEVLRESLDIAQQKLEIIGACEGNILCECCVCKALTKADQLVKGTERGGIDENRIRMRNGQ